MKAESLDQSASGPAPDAVEDVPKRPIGRYTIGLVGIAILALASTLLTASQLTRQESDATVVKESTNQIIRAGDIAEIANRLNDGVLRPDEGVRAEDAADLEQLLAAIEDHHRGLLDGDPELGLPGDNSVEVKALFMGPAAAPDAPMIDTLRRSMTQLTSLVDGPIPTADTPRDLPYASPAFDALRRTTTQLVVELKSNGTLDVDTLNGITESGAEFEAAMQKIVAQYALEAEQRVSNLKTTLYMILAITIIVLVFEGLFLFRPAVQEFRREWQRRAVAHVAERRDDQRKLSYLARFDPLTGLINRFLFGDRLTNAISRARRDGGIVSLMFLDLDEFKSVNDRFGHAVGDALLKQVAQRLVAAVRESDSVARLGGDEFTVVLEGSHRVEDAGHVATKILDSLRQPFRVGNHDLRVTTSIGIALYPVDGNSAQELLRDADIAMYSAKAAGKNTYQYFTPELREKTSERLHLIDGLRRAVEAQRELDLLYQPKVDMRTNQIIGVEALLRWNHPDLGLVLPDRFVPVAEETDLILPIGDWVLEESCRQMKAWQAMGLDLTMSVNVSSRQLKRGDLVESVAHSLDIAGLDPRLLEIELTEGTLVEDTKLAAQTLERLRAMGVQVSIDDFGTGYSSLSYLKRLPIDCLKIDRSFIRDITVSEDAAALSAAIIGLAQSLRLDVVAEGVETTEQLTVLEELGCRTMQGFLFSKPVAAEELRRLVKTGLPDYERTALPPAILAASRTA